MPMEPLTSQASVCWVTPRRWHATRRTRLASSSTTCPSSPRWPRWPRPAETCSNSSRDTRRRRPADSSSVCPGSRPQPTARTLRSKRATRHGSLVLSRRVRERRGSSTSPESSKCQPRRKRESCGKPLISNTRKAIQIYLLLIVTYIITTHPPPSHTSPSFHKQEDYASGTENRPCLQKNTYTSCIFFFVIETFFGEGPPFPHVTVSDHYVSVRVSKKV